MLFLPLQIDQRLNSRGGEVYVTTTDGQTHTLYVTDVRETENWIRTYNIDPVVTEVPGEDWFISLLPTLIMGVVCIFFFIINYQFKFSFIKKMLLSNYVNHNYLIFNWHW